MKTGAPGHGRKQLVPKLARSRPRGARPRLSVPLHREVAGEVARVRRVHRHGPAALVVGVGDGAKTGQAAGAAEAGPAEVAVWRALPLAMSPAANGMAATVIRTRM